MIFIVGPESLSKDIKQSIEIDVELISCGENFLIKYENQQKIVSKTEALDRLVEILTEGK
jgi:hypothetical protein